VSEYKIIAFMLLILIFTRCGFCLFPLDNEKFGCLYLKVSYGEKGRGPGRFILPAYIFKIGEYIYIYDKKEKKFDFFKKTGEYVGFLNLPPVIKDLPIDMCVYKESLVVLGKSLTVYYLYRLENFTFRFKKKVRLKKRLIKIFNADGALFGLTPYMEVIKFREDGIERILNPELKGKIRSITGKNEKIYFLTDKAIYIYNMKTQSVDKVSIESLSIEMLQSYKNFLIGISKKKRGIVIWDPELKVYKFSLKHILPEALWVDDEADECYMIDLVLKRGLMFKIDRYRLNLFFAREYLKSREYRKALKILKSLGNSNEVKQMIEFSEKKIACENLKYCKDEIESLKILLKYNPRNKFLKAKLRASKKAYYIDIALWSGGITLICIFSGIILVKVLKNRVFLKKG